MYTNVSSEFLEVLARPSRHFAARFKDNGTVIDLNIKNMKVTTGTCGGSKLAVGCAYAAYIDVTAVYTDLLLEGKELFLELGLLLDDDSYEWIPFGYWTVQKPKKSMDTMTFQAVDRMAGKLFEDYETALTYPATIQAVLAEFATNTGLTVHCNLQTTQQITVPIEGVTQRGALAVIAATLLGNAWIDRNGDVQITSIGGGTSVPINYDYVKGQPEMDEESTVIEGVKVYTVAGQTDTWMERGSGNMVEVSDVYMTDTILDAVKANIIGLTYGGGEVSFMGNPLLDPSDIIYFRGGSDMVEYMLVTHLDEEIAAEDDANITGLDYKSYNVPCLEIVQEFDGGLLTTVSAPGQFETTEQTYTVGAVTEELRRQAKEITTTQAEVQTAQQSADNAMTTANGKNKIYYQNDAPTSGMGEGDLWFDTDGGNAIWEYKKTASNPDAYEWTLRQLGQGSIAAKSITVNEINVNNLAAISGILGSVTVGGANNADGVITLKNAQGQTIGYWDNAGINANAGKIGGLNITADGLDSTSEVTPGTASTQYQVYLRKQTSGTSYALAALEREYDGSTYGNWAYNFYVRYDGYMSATKGVVGPWTIGSTGIYNGKTGFIPGTNGTYIGTDGIFGETAQGYYWITPSGSLELREKASSTVPHIGIYNTDGSKYFHAGYDFLALYKDNRANTAIWMNIYNDAGSGSSTYDPHILIGADTFEPKVYVGHDNGWSGVRVNGKDYNGGSANEVGLELWGGSEGAQIVFESLKDQALIANYYNNTKYNLIRNHNNGNISISASGSGLYLGYENTTSLNLLNGKGTLDSSGNLTITGALSGNCTAKNGDKNAAIVTHGTSGAYVARVGSNATQISVLGQWGTTGDTYSWRYITAPSSDARLKKNVRDCTLAALPAINAMRIREFDWTDGRHQTIGVVADELEKIDSNLAVGGGYAEDGNMNVKSVNTFYLMGYMLKAIQELSAEVNRLKGVA